MACRETRGPNNAPADNTTRPARPTGPSEDPAWTPGRREWRLAHLSRCPRAEASSFPRARRRTPRLDARIPSSRPRWAPASRGRSLRARLRRPRNRQMTPSRTYGSAIPRTGNERYVRERPARHAARCSRLPRALPRVGPHPGRGVARPARLRGAAAPASPRGLRPRRRRRRSLPPGSRRCATRRGTTASRPPTAPRSAWTVCCLSRRRRRNSRWRARPRLWTRASRP